MRRSFIFGIVALILACGTSRVAAQVPEKKFEDFEKVTAGAKVFEGLFKLYQKDDHVYAEIQPQQLDHPYLAPVALARGMGMGGYTLNDDEQWVLVFKRVGDKIHVIRRNVHFTARHDLPVAKAVETTYTDSILLSVAIKSINPMRASVLIDLNDIYLTNFANLELGMLDPSRTTWEKVKAYPRNLELQVAATFSGGRILNNDSVIDSRGNTVIIHYSLVELPEPGYQSRMADDRVGYFLTAVKDFTSDNRDTAFLRYINRWRLERADGSVWKEGAKLVPPKKRIVYWIEKSVPDEYRSSIREGILEWNKAFEKIGFRDAIEVRQQENEEFDPEDVNYNTFRWITNEESFAMGPSRANPFTGELIDADIIFDASFIRAYRADQRYYKIDGKYSEIASPIQAANRGWLMPEHPLLTRQGWNDKAAQDDPQAIAQAKFKAMRSGFCQAATHKHSELAIAMMAIGARMELKTGDKMTDEMLLQGIKETVMHEVGHTLGLRHNFKGSTMLRNEELHDQAITRKRGLSGSVMDYNPVNLAPKGVKQGDYFSTTLGPYDFWAIEYGYKPLSGGTDGEVDDLKKIAARCAEPGLTYGTDEDMFSTSDPHVNQWDLGSDPLKYAMDRVALADDLAKGMTDRIIDKGEGYQRARMAVRIILSQYGNAAYLSSKFIGGEFMYRDHKGDENARDPLVPVSPAKQREALKFLADKIFNDKTYQFPPELLRKLGADRWFHWGNEMAVMSGVDFSLNSSVLNIQRVALRELLDGQTLSRIQDLSTKTEGADQPLTLAEVFRSLSDTIFADLPKDGKASELKSSIIRRNLQREYLGRLNNMILHSRGVPPDARSLARLHLKQIQERITVALKEKIADDAVRAHLDESKEQIAKVLAASLTASE